MVRRQASVLLFCVIISASLGAELVCRLWDQWHPIPDKGISVQLLASWFVAMHHFQSPVSVNAGESISVGLSVRSLMKLSYFTEAHEINAHEDLGNVLCRLHLWRLACVHNTAPDDALDETFRFGDRIN